MKLALLTGSNFARQVGCALVRQPRISCNRGVIIPIFFYSCLQYHSKLKQHDLNVALMVTSREVYSVLSQLVQCVGCRRSVERLLSYLVDSGNPALEPLIVKAPNMLSVAKGCLSDAKKLYTLFYVHG